MWLQPITWAYKLSLVMWFAGLRGRGGLGVLLDMSIHRSPPITGAVSCTLVGLNSSPPGQNGRHCGRPICSNGFLPEASYGLRVLSSPASVCMCVCVSVNHQFVRKITCHRLKLQSPKLDQKCKTPWLRSLLFLGFIDLELQVQIELKSLNLPHFGLVKLSTQ